MVLVGIALGVILTLAWAELTGGWYTYVLLDRTECQSGGMTLGPAQVAPNQPNPCLLRYPRFSH